MERLLLALLGFCCQILAVNGERLARDQDRARSMTPDSFGH